MYKHALLALLLASIAGCGTTSTAAQTEAKPEQVPGDTIGFAWSDGDRLQVERVAYHSTERGDIEMRCDFTLAARRDGEQLVVEQQDLLPSPLPSPTAHRPYNRLYERFLCVLPSMRISADGRLLGVTGAQALAAKIQPAVLAYYRAHPERFDASLGARVGRQFAAPILEYQATALWAPSSASGSERAPSN